MRFLWGGVIPNSAKNLFSCLTISALFALILIFISNQRPLERWGSSASLKGSVVSALEGWVSHIGYHEHRQYSQNGEDGIVSFILSHVGTDSRFFVEFGVGNGDECITRALHESGGWSGLLMDGCCEDLSRFLHREIVTPENIGSLLRKYSVPRGLDVLSVDTNVYDYYLLESIFKEGYRPRLVVVEVNSKISPAHSKTLMYTPIAQDGWDGGDYFGMSVAAAHALGRAWGYSMLYCEWSGINCFLVRNDLLGVSLSDALTPALLQRAPQYGPEQCGWPRDRSGRTFVDIIAPLKTSSQGDFINLPRCPGLSAW